MRDNIRERFKSNLKKYRLAGKQSGLKYCKSAKTFAEYIKVNYNTYIDYERKGNSPPIEILIRIATALCISIDKLLDYVPPTSFDESQILLFLQDLGIPYIKKCSENNEITYTLYYPASLQNTYYPYKQPPLPVTFLDLCDTVSEFIEMQVSLPQTIQQMIFLEFVKEYNITDQPGDIAERRIQIVQAAKTWFDGTKKLESIKAKNDFNAYFKQLDTMFKTVKKTTRKLDKKETAVFYYGYDNFRGGK